MLKLTFMIFRIQAQQLISNPKDLAKRRLQSHQENGSSSPLSIFEVANLMDQVLFDHSAPDADSQGYFDICYN